METGMDRWVDRDRLTLIVGHSGSGKTEFSVNLALALARRGHPTALADLDVVNPYFRSRERRRLLEEKKVRLVATSQACLDADVPALPPELNTLLQDQSLYSVLDLGGDPTGARVMARYRGPVGAQPHRLCFVLNARRPRTNTLEGARACLEQIQQTMGLRVTHIVGNTHLCGETDVEDLRCGAKLCRELSENTGIPVLCHGVRRDLVEQVGDLGAPIFPLNIYMKKPWELEEMNTGGM